MRKNRIAAKSIFFAYKTKDIDCMIRYLCIIKLFMYNKKIRYEKCRYSKYFQNEMWNIKIDLLSRKKIKTTNQKIFFSRSHFVH